MEKYEYSDDSGDFNIFVFIWHLIKRILLGSRGTAQFKRLNLAKETTLPPRKQLSEPMAEFTSDLHQRYSFEHITMNEVILILLNSGYIEKQGEWEPLRPYNLLVWKVKILTNEELTELLAPYSKEVESIVKKYNWDRMDDVRFPFHDY